jgi:glycosyltransferase involved in cell wall biosynthesis
MYIPAINFLPWRLRDVSHTVVTFHDLRYPYLFPKAGQLRKSSVYHLAGSAEGVIVTNEEDCDELRNQGVKANRLALIPIGSNIQITTPSVEEVSSARNKLGLTSSDTLIGFFGFLNPSKGPEQLVQALSQLNQNFHLVFIGGQIGSSDSAGNREFHEGIVSQIHALEIADRVHWTGFLPDSDVSTFMKAADVMVQPYRDGVSLRRGTLMAVMAHGRPLITTSPKIPITEIIHGETVWLTPIDDVYALSNAIEKVSSDPHVQAELANGAGTVSQLFSWEIITNKTVEFLERMAATSPA